MEANELTASLLTCLKNSPKIDDGIEEFCSMHKGIEQNVVKDFINTKLAKTLFYSSKQPNSFLYQKQLLSSSIVDSIAEKISFLFNKKIYRVCFIIALLLDIAYLILSHNLMRFSSQIDAIIIIGVMIFIILSSLIHEFGHAAAANKFGISTGGIGLGLYINFPVFYTDVTNIWKLPVLQKCIVNIAGIYFQLLILVPIIIAHQITGIEIFRYFIVATNFSFLLNLNPFFRFDGYWLISDITGVPNLRKKSREFFSYIIKRILKYPTKRTPYLLQLKGGLRLSILIYAIVVNIFMAYYILYIIPVFMWSFFYSIPDLTKQFIICLSNNIMPPFVLLQNLFSEILFFVIIIFMLYRLGHNYYANFISKNKRKQSV